MSRQIGPKNRLSRREGVNLTGTSSRSLERRLDVPPGGLRGRPKKASDYAEHLRAKQRVKREYGMTERQFIRFFEMARRLPGATGEHLMVLLERRLDNVIFRAGFALTRPQARQLVVHGHIKVNEAPLTVPSYIVKPGDVLTLEQGMATRILEDTRGGAPPAWLSVEANVARVVGMPRREELDRGIRESLIVEFYAQ